MWRVFAHPPSAGASAQCPGDGCGLPHSHSYAVGHPQSHAHGHAVSHPKPHALGHTVGYSQSHPHSHPQLYPVTLSHACRYPQSHGNTQTNPHAYTNPGDPGGGEPEHER